MDIKTLLMRENLPAFLTKEIQKIYTLLGSWDEDDTYWSCEDLEEFIRKALVKYSEESRQIFFCP